VRVLVELAFVMGLLVPVAPAPRPSPSPNNPSNPTLGSVQPSQPREDLIMFLLGRVATVRPAQRLAGQMGFAEIARADATFADRPYGEGIGKQGAQTDHTQC
jgi:hypothetical protein